MGDYRLSTVNTGSVSFKAYGTAIRSVQLTRGNRQGNQAFLPGNLIKIPLNVLN